MKQTINPLNHTVLYTVRTSTLIEGCITCVEAERLKVGDFVRNVQFVDIFGNNTGRDGYIEKIISTSYYSNGEYIKFELTNDNK
jgi:hypothetical protein